MDKNVEIKYEIIAIFDKGDTLKWEFDSLTKTKTRYEEIKKYKGLKDLKCNQIMVTIEKVNLF